MTQQRTNRIGIVTKNERFANFFEWEAILCGFSVQKMTKPPEDTSTFDKIILDSSAGYCLSGNSRCAVVTVFTEDAARSPIDGEIYWEWPVSSEVVSQFLQERELSSDSEKTVDKSSDPCIYLLSQKDRLILYRNREITLTDHEWKFLLLLAKHKGETVDVEQIKTLLGAEKGNMPNVYAHYLRKKLEEPFGIRLLTTVRGKGYCLSVDVKSLIR